MTETVLFVHAYPADETLSTGATIATLVERGAAVSVLTCIPGESGQEQELSAALAALGVTDHRFLGAAGARWEGRAERSYPDSEALLSADPGEVASDIAARILDLQPDVVVSPDGGTGHPDHGRVHHATRTATSVLGVPFYVVGEGKSGTVRVDPAPVLDRKRAALEAYRSRLVVDGDTVAVPPSPAEPIASVESFHRMRTAGSSFSDYGLGARIVTCILALLLGAFVGATLTVAHQASVMVLGVRVPWGIIAGLVITAALIVGLRMVFETRVVAGFAALGLLGASAFLAVQSAGGSILVPDNVAGYVWTFGPVLIVGIALAWPQVRRAPGSNIEGTSVKGSVSL